MNERPALAASAAGGTIAERVEAVDWARVIGELDTHGCARVEALLTAAECDAIADLYAQRGLFRNRVVMASHGFGSGEYQYFDYPLPEGVAGLRTAIYPHLAPLATRWR